MNVNRITALYSILHSQVLPFASSLADSQVANQVRLMEGLFEGRSVHLSRIASEITATTQLSVVTPLTRFLGNGLAYRGRALPLIWTWLEYPRGHSLTATQVDLLSTLRAWLPEHAQVALVGDSEYGRCWLQEELTFGGWQYALRQSSRNRVWRKTDTGFLSLDQIELRGLGVQWFPHTLLTEENALPTHILGYWAAGQDTPWWLATNLTTPDEVMALYPYRLWTEEMFGALKGNGFDLAATHLRHTDKLIRLTLAVSLLYVRLVALGVELTKLGRAHEVDRPDRRARSFFRPGFDFLKHTLKLKQPLLPGFFPDFAWVYGS